MSVATCKETRRERRLQFKDGAPALDSVWRRLALQSIFQTPRGAVRRRLPSPHPGTDFGLQEPRELSSLCHGARELARNFPATAYRTPVQDRRRASSSALPTCTCAQGVTDHPQPTPGFYSQYQISRIKSAPNDDEHK